MKKIVLPAALAILATPAFAADCYKALTADHTKDSQAFQLSEEEVGNQDDIGIEYARSAVDALVVKLGCDQPLKIDHGASECGEIVPGIAESQACYIKTNVGYFITNVDYMMNTNIVFNRFD